LHRKDRQERQENRKKLCDLCVLRGERLQLLDFEKALARIPGCIQQYRFSLVKYSPAIPARRVGAPFTPFPSCLTGMHIL
jgi:hypothetical protein